MSNDTPSGNDQIYHFTCGTVNEFLEIRDHDRFLVEYFMGVH